MLCTFDSAAQFVSKICTYTLPCIFCGTLVYLRVSKHLATDNVSSFWRRELVAHLNRVHVHSQFLRAANCGRISHSAGNCCYTPVFVAVSVCDTDPNVAGLSLSLSVRRHGSKRLSLCGAITAQCSSQQPTATPWWDQILIELLATNVLLQSSQLQSGMI